MDFSLVNLDLGKVISDLKEMKKPKEAAIKDITKWLAKEKISERDYEICVNLAADVARPNEEGLSLRTSIFPTKATLPGVETISLIQPRAIGRWMALSEEHAWIVTTTVVLARFQSLDVVPGLLARMIVFSNDLTTIYPKIPEDLVRLKLHNVLEHVTSSISLNVVNVGHSVNDFPESIRDHCKRHLTHARSFPEIVVALNKRVLLSVFEHGDSNILLISFVERTDLLLHCERFPADLVLWILNHYHGRIEVIIAGKVEYRKTEPRTMPLLEVFVERVCQSDTGSSLESDLCGEIYATISLYKKFRGAVGERLVKGQAEHPSPFRPPAARQDLYTIDVVQPKSATKSQPRNELRSKANIFAQRLIAWMIGLPVYSPCDPDFFGFQVDLLGSNDSKSLKLGHLFAQSPYFLNWSIGSRATRDFIVMPPEGRLEETMSAERQRTSLLECFPSLGDLVKDVTADCKCFQCIAGQGLAGNSGCLGDEAISVAFVKVAHAIADGFGVSDASALVKLRLLASHVQRLLARIVYGHVRWADWFIIALMVATGKDIDLAPGWVDDPETDHIVGVQHGSWFAIARWFDMNRPLNLRGILSLDLLEAQAQGIEDDSIFFGTHKVATIGPIKNSAAPKSIDELEIENLRLDTSSVSLDHAFMATHLSYRLLSIVSSENHKRIVDPAMAVLKLIQFSAQRRHCEHKHEELGTFIDNIKVLPRIRFETCNFSQILDSWDSQNDRVALNVGDELPTNTNPEELGTVCQITSMLDTPLKVNVAMAMGAQGRCVRLPPGGKLCLRCICIVGRNPYDVPEIVRIINDGSRPTHALAFKEQAPFRLTDVSC